MAIDAALMMAATFSFWITSPPEGRPLTWLQAGAVALILLIGYQVVMRWTRSYRVEHYGNVHRSLTDVCLALLLAGIPALIIVAAFVPSFEVQKRWLSGWAGATFICLILGRWLAGLLVYVVQKHALLRRRVIVVGAGDVSEDVVRRLRTQAVAVDYKLLGVIDPRTNVLRQEPGAAVAFGNARST